MKIYIPSKGRPGAALIRALIDGGDRPRAWLVIVEPQDAGVYADAGVTKSHLGILTRDNQGISFVRQAIREAHRRQHPDSPWYWMFDDDISSFKRQDLTFTRPRMVQVSMGGALDYAEGLIEERSEVDEGFAMAAMEYQQFSWSAKKDWRDGSYCEVAVAIHAERSAIASYRDEVNLKEDRDFVMQLLSHGRRVGRMARVGFSAPKNGSNTGGLFDVYSDEGRELVASMRMCDLWPDFCKAITKKDGRHDVKINWRKVREDGEARSELFALLHRK